MMMTRVLMSCVDVDDSGVNGVHSDRVELEEIMMTLVLTVVMTMMILVLMLTSKDPCYAQATWNWICFKKTKQNKN